MTNSVHEQARCLDTRTLTQSGALSCTELARCRDCQAAHWKAHKKRCIQGKPRHPILAWQDRFRKCDDGNRHFGTLDLITWDGIDPDCEDMELGWGGVVREEAAEHKEKFEKEYGSDKGKFCEYWPGAFRWTCCGMRAIEGWAGCDHHGHPDAPSPCTCDFCKAGRPLSDRIHNKRVRSQAAQGLALRRGPDPNARGFVFRPIGWD